MSAEASTPTTAPRGTRAAISAVVFPFPQPTSRIRSVPLRSSDPRTSSAMAACKVEIRAYSDAFHSVIPLHSGSRCEDKGNLQMLRLRSRRRRRRERATRDRWRCVSSGRFRHQRAGRSHPGQSAAQVQRAMECTTAFCLKKEPLESVRFHQLLADFVAYINGRSKLACRHQSSFSVSQGHSLFSLVSPEDIRSYSRFFGVCDPSKGECGMRKFARSVSCRQFTIFAAALHRSDA